MNSLAERVLPLLAFLATVVVLAELVARAEVFDVVAARLARVGRGRTWALFVLSVGLATLTTVCLNLDTTAVLLTPVLLALATRIEVPALPLAMGCVWLANTASLLLPVSNLTNLLAAGRVDLPPLAFAARMLLPFLASVLVTALFLWVLYWRRTMPAGYPVPEPHRPRDAVLTAVAAVAVLGFLVAVLLDAPLWTASGGAAVVVVLAFAVRQRSELSVRLVPWTMLVLVALMFGVVGFVSEHGLDDVLGALVGDGSPWRTAATGALSANLVNNLPAYLAGESAVLAGPHVLSGTDPLLGLLIGVNVGPLVTPWASLATLIWFQRCRAAGLRPGVIRFALSGLALAVVATAAATAALTILS